MDKYDVVVIGAGPAGSSAACSAAKKGLHVLMVERRAVVGVPIQCAEYIPALLFGNGQLPRDVRIQAIKEMHSYLPGNEVKITRAPGFIVARDRFDQALADKAQRAGVQLETSTSATAIDSRGTRIQLKKRDGASKWIKARIIIGADGPQSKVAKWTGFAETPLMAAAQVRVCLQASIDHTEVHFKKNIRGGYGWLFPRGRQANVGLGVAAYNGQKFSLRSLLRSFLKELESEGKVTGRPRGAACGWIPLSPKPSAVNGNIALAGDAAGQTHPITGAGILAAVTCGAMLGEYAAEAILRNDISLLRKYDKSWRLFLGDTLDRAVVRRQFLEKNWDRLDQIAKYCWVAFPEYYAENIANI